MTFGLPSGDAPATLFHYTTAAGLLGILTPRRFGSTTETQLARAGKSSRGKSFSLFATDARYLNDSSEIVFAAEALADAIEEIATPDDRRGIPTLVSLLRERVFSTWSAASHRPKNRSTYVTCFCEKGDLLSQWRGYGSNGGGYSIEFETTALRSLFGVVSSKDQEAAKLSSLHRVSYGIDKAAIAKGASEILADQRASPMTDCVSFLAQFKSEAFREEQEWRVIANGFGGILKREFRSGAQDTIIPYVTLHHRPSSTTEGRELQPAAIRSVTVGPGQHQTLRVDAVRELLDYRGFVNAEVKVSRTTYRG
ncbi:DUF2971 domain-containing protein [Smaragdicoccus niigatensis]|uniref:DUF2971 domain-containing protein n=1 Tax=Smaragdicoccus niigatensis TaxID=359359 RepID=UPI00036C5A4A|nr:DUF2971 domain-containing protein [Smaragdicoccus niigatensis]